MARAFSNREITDAKFKFEDFTGEWLASFGRPELKGAWIIFGQSGSGKTHFALMLAKYLSQFVNRVAYDTVEQGRSGSFQEAWRTARMDEIKTKIIGLDREQVPELKERLRRRKSPDVVFIDSITALVGFTRSEFAKLINEFPDKLFVFLAHEDRGKPYPAIAEHVRKLSEIKIHVEGFKAFTTTRFSGGTGADFVIWPEGAAEYMANLEE